ncbi:MAG TPA: sporulation protein YqfD [Bacillota bacterium]|nr:sporulation protein YqfD [Bacillota bacterium]
MKEKSNQIFTHSVVFKYQGNNIVRFLNTCKQANIQLKYITFERENVIQAYVPYKDYEDLREIGTFLHGNIEKVATKGIFFIFKRIFIRKEVILSFFFSMIILCLLSNMIWSIQIKGLPKNVEQNIIEVLDHAGIKQGRFLFNIPATSEIQQYVMREVPELLWIGVEQQGTSLHLEGVEKLEVEKEIELEPRDLLANKEAIIKKMYVETGQPMVNVHDFVEENDILVSGKITKDDSENNDEHHELVAAKGEVIGEAWYEVAVSIPLEGTYKKLTGKQYSTHTISLSSFFNIPLTGLMKKEYKDFTTVVNRKPINFLFWEMPIYIQKTIFYEVETFSYKISKEKAIEKGNDIAIQALKRQIGPEIRINSKKLLQETEENGKVNLILYFNVEENIVKSRPINQGD